MHNIGLGSLKKKKTTYKQRRMGMIDRRDSVGGRKLDRSGGDKYVRRKYTAGTDKKN